MGNLVVLGTAVQKRMEAFYSGRTPLKVDYRERAGTSSTQIKVSEQGLGRRDTHTVCLICEDFYFIILFSFIFYS